MTQAEETPPTLWQKFNLLLLWEKPVEMMSELSMDEAIQALQALIMPVKSWRNYVPGAYNKPLTGNVVGRRGWLKPTLRLSRINGVRALKFSLNQSGSGSILNGKLQADLPLYLYEWAVIAGAAVLECAQVYGIFVVKPHFSLRLVLEFFRPLLFAPLLWCYVWLCLWFSRRRETELLSLVGKALVRKSQVSSREPKPSSPTEIFIRPREQSPEDHIPRSVNPNSS